MSIDDEQSLDELAADVRHMKDEIRSLERESTSILNRINVAKAGLRTAVERFDARVAKVKS